LKYKIRWHRKAHKELQGLPKVEQRKIVEAIERLIDNPSQGKSLKGRWQGLFRIRVGKYRVIYSIESDQMLILILKIGHRKDVYR